ncbi:Type 1 glutamine amidotransferase-like domain-containing protein [Niallia sp.]|uniref:Type 1 glutamine amidotransferase-like domain-containing protein n=1 Tax=Niallia sp. TaxID=2837523 RepID=UPI00289BABD8|nr:Type 1 glutamine amidotransferase-like domain-containing protein [Niallia sp.]
MDRHLFLFGGGPPFTSTMAREFSQLATVRKGKVSLLILDRTNWKEYMTKYTNLLKEFGFTEFQYIPLPTVPVEEAIQHLSNSSGIIIGGGNTELYAKYIVDTTISKTIKKQFVAGVPIAGFSAGALISMENCVISAKDNDAKVIKFRKGLGLIKDTVIAVHYSEWMDESHLRTAVKTLKPIYNFGIDEGTGMYFCNNKLIETEGAGVFSLKNNHFEKIE